MKLSGARRRVDDASLAKIGGRERAMPADGTMPPRRQAGDFGISPKGRVATNVPWSAVLLQQLDTPAAVHVFGQCLLAD
jgi:hypothetical protein